jgi:hypothetical protein
MLNGPQWSNSPIVVLTLAAAVLGIIFIPFAIWDTDHAAQFFGSFSAAIVAAIAVIGTTTLQAHFARQQRKEVRREDMLAEALELYAWMFGLAVDIGMVEKILHSRRSSTPSMTVAEYRQNLPLDVRVRLRNRLVIASRLPQPYGHQVVDLLHKVDSVIDTISYMLLLSDPKFSLSDSERESRRQLAYYYQRLIHWERAKLGEYLVREDALSALGPFELQILQSRRPAIDDPRSDGFLP